ncbi:MAG: hypothetical protein WC346_16115 [Methanogenium sp.]
MSVGSDLKKAFQKVGVSFTIKRHSGDISGEYLIYDIPISTKNPFDREVTLEATLAYDTVVIEGDILELVDNRKVLVAHKTPDLFQDAAAVQEAVLFKCNVTNGIIMRESGERNLQTYQNEPSWEIIYSGESAVLVEVGGNQLSDREELGLISVSKLELYLPSGEGLRVLDRFQAFSGEYYKVDALKKNLYPNITVAEVSEDTR